MNIMDEVELRGAESAFAVANTPLFLMRKLRSDPTIALLARKRRGEELLASLRDIAGKEPQDPREFVLPYVYLVALSLKQDLSHLREAATIAQPYADWYRYIGDYLVQSTIPTETKTILFSNQILTPTISLASSANTKIENLTVR
jgi:hypothetical protein